MSELEAIHFCEKCKRNTIHLFSGSATKGTCMDCGNDLPPDVRADFSKAISYNG